MSAARDGLKRLKTTLDSTFPRTLGRWVVGVVGAMVLSLLSAFIYENIHEAGQYRIAVVGIDVDRMWEDIKEGVEEYKLRHREALQELNIQVSLINHKGHSAEAQERAKQLMEDRRVLAVIFAGNSSQAEELLQNYRGEKSVLLVRATNPHLNLSHNMFRLPPNDTKQVEALTDFARLRWSQANEANTRIAIFRDATNETYASFLGDNLREMLDRLIASTEADEDRGIRVVVDGWIGGRDHGIHISSEFVDQMQPELIFYAGNGRSLLPLIHQAAGFTNWSPTLVLTDGSVDSEFLRLAQGRFREAYATFPVSPKEESFSKSRPSRPSTWEDEPSYKPYGYDALGLLLDAIRQMNPSKEIDEKSTVPAAARIAEALERIDYEGIASNYGFRNGENTEGRFHVYRAVRDGLTWRWEHSPSDCPVTIP
jgi:ABC-type branched-subunit amino acid transport system substrate-binding protein